MKTIYICEWCGEIFHNQEMCERHEQCHKLDPYANLKKDYIDKCFGIFKEPCAICSKGYYTYGISKNCSCQENCNKDNFWTYFEPKYEFLKENEVNEKSND